MLAADARRVHSNGALKPQPILSVGAEVRPVEWPEVVFVPPTDEELRG